MKRILQMHTVTLSIRNSIFNLYISTLFDSTTEEKKNQLVKEILNRTKKKQQIPIFFNVFSSFFLFYSTEN